MEKIIIKGLTLKAYHGVNPEEKENGQNFVLDITALTDIGNAHLSDDLNETVSYAKIIKTVRAVFTEKSYDLIERAAHVVCEALLKNYHKIAEVTVLLKKPEAPISAEFDYVAVEETLCRKDLQ